MWDIIKAILEAVMPVAQTAASGAISNAMRPDAPSAAPAPTTPALQGGFNGLGAMGPGSPAPGSNPGLQGSGTATRPASLNFTGGFTGSPPSVPGANPAANGGMGGFSTLDRARRPQYSGGI